MGEPERMDITLKGGLAVDWVTGAAAASRGSAREVSVNFIVDWMLRVGGLEVVLYRAS